jgi:hypothetical protein
VNRSGFLLIKEASASYHTHRKTPPCIRQTYPPTRMRSQPHDLPSSTALRSRTRSPILNRIAQSEMRAIVDLTSEPRYKGHNAQHGRAFRTAPSHRVTKRKTSRPPIQFDWRGSHCYRTY